MRHQVSEGRQQSVPGNRPFLPAAWLPTLQDLLGETPVPLQLKDQPSFSFLAKKLELALQQAA